MAATSLHAALLGAVLVLTGCSDRTELWPMLSGEPSSDAKVDSAPLTPPLPQSQSSGQSASTQSASTQMASISTTSLPASTSGTFVGQKINQLRGDLQRLQTQVNEHKAQLQQVREDALQNGQRYYGSIAAINARLQIGTTPGNPLLVQQWNESQAALDRIGDDVARLNNLANSVAGDSALASYILEATRAAFSISGAVDEDHRQLAILEDDTNRTVVVVDRLLNEISDDISRQTAYVNNERRNLTTLSVAIKNGELFGGSLANRSFGASPTAMSPTSLGRAPVSGLAMTSNDRRPLVVIKFDRQNVAFQQPLYNAVSQALDRRPDATFEIVAVTPNRGNAGQVALASTASRRNAEAVYRSLTDMGLPANRVSLSATNSPSADTTEVHVFVR